MAKLVTLQAVTPTNALAGYQAVLIEREDDEFGPDEYVDTILRHGPSCDALLIARTRAIRWAVELGVPYIDD